MSPEATTAGETEQTRIPDGPRKSAIPWEIPITAARIVSLFSGENSRRRHTLAGAVGETPGRDRVGHSRGNVDDAAALVVRPRSERTLVGVLRVDGIGDARIDDEGPVDVDVECLLEVLAACQLFVWLAEAVQLTATESFSLLDHSRDVATAAQCTPPARLPLGITLRASAHASDTRSTLEISTLK
jgi:hypothetical protein